MAHTHSTHEDAARDVLAAEEFGVPAVDPALHAELPHDVLAAEEFGVPAIDPAIHHGPVALPGDPTGIAEPHDVLAAEEFALPAGRVAVHADGGSAWGPRIAVVVGATLALIVTRRIRRRSS